MRFAKDSLLSASVLLRLSIISSYCVEKLNLQSLKHSMDALKAARIFLIFCVTPASSSRIEDAQLPPMSSHLTFLMILSCFLRATTSCAIESYVTHLQAQHTSSKHASHLMLHDCVFNQPRALSLRFLLCMHTRHLKCATCQAHASVPHTSSKGSSISGSFPATYPTASCRACICF